MKYNADGWTWKQMNLKTIKRKTNNNQKNKDQN